MPRLPRIAPGGMVYHVINRAHGKRRLFRSDNDYLEFQQIIARAEQRVPLRLLGWCIMPDHWHFIAWPRKADELSKFFGYLSLTHAARWKIAHRKQGEGRLYRPRFKHFMIQPDEHLTAAMQFVESNPLREGQVKRAQDWPWSSLHARLSGPAELKALLSAGPVKRPADWTRRVNREMPEDQLNAILHSMQRGSPFGDPKWITRTASKYHLESTLRPRGRQPGWRKYPQKRK